MTDLRIVVRPDWHPRDYVESERRRIAAGLRRAAETETQATKQDLRDQVVKAGLGRRLSLTWRGATYPADAGRATLHPAVFVYSVAPAIINAFDDGATIVPTDGKRWLWIPTENVPLGQGNKPFSPQRMLEMVGKFRFAKGRRGSVVAYAQVERTSKRSGRRGHRLKRYARPQAGEAGESVAFFILVRQVSLKKRLDIAAIGRAAEVRYAARVRAVIGSNA